MSWSSQMPVICFSMSDHQNDTDPVQLLSCNCILPMDRVSGQEHLKCCDFLLCMNFSIWSLITLNFSCKLWQCYCSLLNQTNIYHFSVGYIFALDILPTNVSECWILPASSIDRKYSCAQYFACQYEWMWDNNYVRKFKMQGKVQCFHSNVDGIQMCIANTWKDL